MTGSTQRSAGRKNSSPREFNPYETPFKPFLPTSAYALAASRHMHQYGTTREQPLVLFEAERPLLRRLPAIAPDLGSWHRVVLHRDCHVQFEKSLYSAPFTLVGDGAR